MSLTKEQLESLSGAELARMYNELTGSKIKAFNKKSDGIRRILEEQAARGTSPAATTAEEPPPEEMPPASSDEETEEETVARAKAKAKTKAPGKGRAPRKMDYPPLKGAPLHKIREGGARAKLVEALSGRGTTLAEAAKAARLPQGKVRAVIRILNWYVGYGVRETSDGRIQLYT